MSASPAITDSVFRFQAMGGPCSVRLQGLPPDDAARAAALAEAEVRRIERKYSRYRDDSVIAAINAAAGHDEGIAVDDETAMLLDFAALMHDQSDGRFDVTSGVLREVWDFRAGRLPAPEAVAALLPRIGWRQLVWPAPEQAAGAATELAATASPAAKRHAGRRLVLPVAGMALDFGGIGKEYAADRAAAVLREAGASHGLVELGGDVAVAGPPLAGDGWRVGIRNPRGGDDALARIHVASGGLATSGDYERCLVVDGRRYSHLLDARSGWPVSGAPASLSVAAPSCLLAGAAATLGMLAGAGAGDWLADCPWPWLAIADDLGMRGSLA